MRVSKQAQQRASTPASNYLAIANVLTTGRR